MLTASIIFYWVSGLSLGLTICAIFSCPHAQLASPFMLLLSVLTGFIGYKKR